MKKIFIGLAATGTAIAMLPLFAAFEAHVINVTARIENALTVPVKFLEYGTVFPQEYLLKDLDISLSGSFLTEDRVDDVEYFIRQKPKCAITTNGGQSYDATVGNDGSHAYTTTGHVNVVLGDDPATTSTVETDFPIVSIDCGAAPRPLAVDDAQTPSVNEAETWGVLPSLCPYLSKHKGDEDRQEQETQLDAFHIPYTVNPDGSISWNDAKGYLTKLDQDVADNWKIDLAVPCFGNYCAQDWASFVESHNTTQDTQEEADSWTQPIENEHKVFGCDLWVEVSGVSETPALPQCSDGVDNADPEDSLVDSADPGCYDDNNVYQPLDNDETDIVS
jgi:hypothetical protein